MNCLLYKLEIKTNTTFKNNAYQLIKSALHITVLLISFSWAALAQENLVVNGDFEEYSDCPQTVTYPAQVVKEIEKCVGWRTPTYGTADYFNACTSNQLVSVPLNTCGEQTPFSGTGYLGQGFTYTGGAGDDGYNGVMWWEYIQGKLLASLEAGHIYKFSMEISLAEYSDLMITEVGVYFSNVPISTPNTAALTVSPQIVFYKPDYFRDTANWIHLETYFIANGNEKYLTIGNFRDNISTDTLRRYNHEPFLANPYVTYFYIDAVSLTDATDLIANSFTPNGDGINDIWKLPVSGDNSEMKVCILNRWGNLIKEGDLKDFTWDGKAMNGNECPDGTYFYRISGTNVAGFIELMR